MGVSDITRITLENVPLQKRNLLGKVCTVPDEAICIYTGGGRIVLRRSAVTAAGGGWQRLKAALYDDAPKNGIPFADLRGSGK